jgi:hypothetical protein
MRGDALTVAVGIVTFALGILVSYLFYKLGRERRHLDYEVIARVRLLRRVSSPAMRQLKLTLNDQTIDDPHVIVLRIINSGNRDIAAADFEGPISITFEEPIRILSAEIIKKSNGDIDIQSVIQNAFREILLI